MQDIKFSEQVKTGSANVAAFDRAAEVAAIDEEYDVSIISNDFNASTVCNFMEHGGITVPIFQRDYVWNRRKASRLIESIILGLPVPEIFVYEMKRNDWYVVDGQQRLLSLYYFSKGRFPINKPQNEEEFFPRARRDKIALGSEILGNERLFSDFSLDLTPPYEGGQGLLHGNNYDELTPSLRQQFELRPIRIIVIRPHGQKIGMGAVEVFERLNSGGENLSAQQIRCCIFQSPFIRMISDLSGNPSWRKIFGRKFSPKGRDTELILRALAMLAKTGEDKEYTARSAARFLDQYCADMRDKSGEDKGVLLLRKMFEEFMRACEGAEGVFSRKGQFRSTLFEAVFVASLSKYYRERQMPEGKVINADAVMKLADNAEFFEASQQAVMKQENVRKRLEIASQNCWQFLKDPS